MALAASMSCSSPASPEPERREEQTEEPEYIQDFLPIGSSEHDSQSSNMLVSDIRIPRAFAPCLHTDELTMEMAGFKEDYLLVFKADSGEEYEMEILDYSSDILKFRLHERLLPGDYELSVVSDDCYQYIGTRYVMCDIPSGIPGINVSGKVTIAGVAAAGVVISDGFAFTVSASDGRYNLISEKANGYVFAQTPANAVARVEGAVPQFFKYLTGDKSVVETADFEFEASDNIKHRFLLLADLHLDRSKTESIRLCNELFMPDLNATIDATDVPCFIFTAGDQTTESRWNTYDFDLDDWRNYVSDWKCPVYHCMGNHDNDPAFSASDWDSESTYKKKIGPSWYSLDIGKVHYVVLDDIIYDNSDATKQYGYYVRVAQHQLDYLKKDLLKVPHTSPVVIITHSPMFITDGLGSVANRFESLDDINELLDCLDAFEEVHILSGHTHINHNIEVRNGVYEHNVAASSASTWYCEWSTGKAVHYCRDGTIGGYQIWDADGADLRWVHKSMGRSVSEGQFHCVDLNEVPENYRGTKDEDVVLINVYNWDDKWTVSVTENGLKRSVTQAYRKDPVYNMIFPEPISSQTNPVNTEHIFLVRASSADSDLDITVTDRFGNRYSGKMLRPFAFTLENYD